LAREEKRSSRKICLFFIFANNNKFIFAFLHLPEKKMKKTFIIPNKFPFKEEMLNQAEKQKEAVSFLLLSFFQ